MNSWIFSAYAAAAMLAALPGRALEVQVSYGADGSQARIRIQHPPANEPLGALRIRLKLKESAGASALTLYRPDAGPWSQLAPELRREGQVAEILAVAPAMGESRVAALVTVAELGLQLSRPGLRSAADLVDSMWVEEALLPWGGKAAVGSRLTTALGKAAPFPQPPSQRIQGSRRTLTFTLARESDVRVEVMDARGRQAVQVFAGRMRAGMNEVAWDGAGRGGKPLPPGRWFLRLEAGSFTYDTPVEVKP